MKILITGGAGYLGSVIVDKMLKAGYEVVVLDKLLFNQTSLLQYTSNSNFKFIYGDVRNETLLEELCIEADVIIPLAAIVGFPACAADPQLANEINFKQIFNIVRFAKDKKILYPNTNSGYGIGVGQTECTEESPLNPISVYGNMFEKNFKRNFIHIEDVASAFLFMLENYEQYKGEVFNVGLSSANLSKQELLEKIQSHVKDFAVSYNDYYEDPDKRDYIVSNAKIEATGWVPHWGLDKGIKQLIQGYQMIVPKMGAEFRNGFPLGYANRT